MNDNHNNYKPYITLLLFILMVAVNAAANIVPINGVGTGEVSDSFPNLFAPAAITFSIWGVIYLLLFIFCIYYVLRNKTFTMEKQRVYTKIADVFCINSLLNAVWIFAWHYKNIILSFIVMLLILFTLIKINMKIRNAKEFLTGEILIKLSFGIYFGWITIATIANTTTLLKYLNWGGFGISEELWTVIIVIIGAVIASAAIRFFRNIAYALVIVWAYAGIIIKHVTVFNSEYSMIIITVALMMAAITGISVLLAIDKLRNANSKYID